ncbi:hypothetical protein GGX14DRAFT_403313 [Mycena pura]|uniref:Uncharacterized protein n=1 Tax=Mycena pura TaxID=153505 RepID=A0AAD6V005_9AGAR|nr:hypothetical protein GGX14DRAFT_403313 [Mycena pura]
MNGIGGDSTRGANGSGSVRVRSGSVRVRSGTVRARVGDVCAWGRRQRARTGAATAYTYGSGDMRIQERQCARTGQALCVHGLATCAHGGGGNVHVRERRQRAHAGAATCAYGSSDNVRARSDGVHVLERRRAHTGAAVCAHGAAMCAAACAYRSSNVLILGGNVRVANVCIPGGNVRITTPVGGDVHVQEGQRSSMARRRAHTGAVARVCGAARHAHTGAAACAYGVATHVQKRRPARRERRPCAYRVASCTEDESAVIRHGRERGKKGRERARRRRRGVHSRRTTWWERSRHNGQGNGSRNKAAVVTNTVAVMSRAVEQE